MPQSETTQRVLRIVVPLFVGGLVLAISLPSFFKQKQAAPTAATSPASQPATSPDALSPASQPQLATSAPANESPASPTAVSAFTGLHAVAAAAPQTAPASQTLNPNKDPRQSPLIVDTTHLGAGLTDIRFSDIWQTPEARHKSAAYLKTLDPSVPFDITKVDDADRYTLESALSYTPASSVATYKLPLFAATSIQINGTSVSLFSDSIWTQSAPGTFTATVVDGDNHPVLEIRREFIVSNSFDIALNQKFTNRTDAPLEIVWSQYGPPELNYDPNAYIDKRRIDIGYRPEPANYPDLVLSNNSALSYDHAHLLKRRKNAQSASPSERQQEITLWPGSAADVKNFDFTWFAAIDRYFGLAVHPAFNSATPLSLAPQIQSVQFDFTEFPADPQLKPPPTTQAITYLVSPKITIAPANSADINLGIYAGPLRRDILTAEPYSKLALSEMIVYSMGSMCSFCTFQWLAHLLLWYLSFLHSYITFDWALAIIGLVITVRAILHPLTKRSQINMQRFGKKMGALKPEIEKLQKKYANEPQKIQQEQMRLMREHGVNPLQMLGCLPLFLQTPIWIALYATLYLAFDLRHQPAFFGLFQLFNGWSFLSDLSSQDAFIPLGAGFYIPLIGTHITSINLLPILMAVVFFIQQQYLTPPTAATMTPEQQSQQKIMKWMMVFLFPLMMFKAPSGLTLYIMTSSIIGILESRYVRAHIAELDKNPPPDRSSRFKPKDRQSHAYASILERLEAKRREAAERSYKKRK
ncbi:MAG TPA: membrane protein insertase YidC [Phycisphaerales bacterium]|nr:membrane protein insertase YidC [Phycisphaerales bacterium]